MAQDNFVKLPTKAPSSLRSKTIGRLSILSGKQPQDKNAQTPKGQTWHKVTPEVPGSLRTVPRPKLTWEPGMFNISYILRNLPLPRVVICDHSFCDLGRATMGFDCGQLLMLSSKTETLKIQAGSLAVDTKDNKTLVETDDRLVIPEDYKGWFAVLGTELTLKAVPHYRQVSQLAQSDCHTFLIGGTENVRSMKKTGDSISESRHLCPGDIMKMGTMDETERYLHCTDDNDRDVLIPVTAQGMFYVMKNKVRQSKIPILQIKDILQKYQFPCVVKLVYGREPSGEGIFTKLLTLEGVQQETSVLASTILKSKNTLHELAVDFPNKFRVAVQSKELVLNPGYISALNLCQDKGDLFMRCPKIFRNIQGCSPIESCVKVMGISFSSPESPVAAKSPQTNKALTSTKSCPPALPPERVKSVASSPKPPPSPVITSSPVQGAPTPVLTQAPASKPTQVPKPESVVAPVPFPVVAPVPSPVVAPVPSPVGPKTVDQVSKQDKPLKPQSTIINVNSTPSIRDPVHSEMKEPQQHKNGVSESQTTSHTIRQRNPNSGLPPPPPMLTEIHVKSAAGLHEPRLTPVQNGGDKSDKAISPDNDATVQAVNPNRSRANRPAAYEEVWTATSGKEDTSNEELSSTSSSMSDFMTTGMGGQIVTGGLAAPSEQTAIPEPQTPPSPPPSPPLPPPPMPLLPEPEPEISVLPHPPPPPPPPITLSQPSPKIQPQPQQQQELPPQLQPQLQLQPQPQQELQLELQQESNIKSNQELERGQNVKETDVDATDAKKQVQSLLEHYSSVDNEKEPLITDETQETVPRSRQRKSTNVYSTIDIIDGVPRSKKVSFSDILDVKTFTKAHVTTIDVHEMEAAKKRQKEMDKVLAKHHSLGSDFRPGYSGDSTSWTSGLADDTSSGSSSLDDDSGYMMPILDRKGRVRSQRDSHKTTGTSGKSHEDLAKRLSLPKMRVSDPRDGAKRDTRRDSETDILW